MEKEAKEKENNQKWQSESCFWTETIQCYTYTRQYDNS